MESQLKEMWYVSVPTLAPASDPQVYFPLHPDDRAQLTRIEDKLDQILAKLYGPRGEVP